MPERFKGKVENCLYRAWFQLKISGVAVLPGIMLILTFVMSLMPLHIRLINLFIYPGICVFMVHFIIIVINNYYSESQ